MAELLKNMYNRKYIETLAGEIKAVYGAFNVDGFVGFIMDETWEKLELKERGLKITAGLGEYLPKDYHEAVGIIDNVISNYGSWLDGFALFFPEFVSVYGQNESDWDVSMGAIERWTVHASAEFAVRPFIINNEDKMMVQMFEWSKHKNEHVRRLSSEGCRPALPWGQALVGFKKDPLPVLSILEQLKTDEDLYVRKSVANNLNDISKTHPDLVAKIAKEWYGKDARTDWIVKHGCRTLLKRGNREVLEVFGYNNVKDVSVENFALSKNCVIIGEELSFSFDILAEKQTKVRLEYGIDYVKANGKRNRKMFKISEVLLKDNERKSYVRKHSFEDLSTRKHYAGVHCVVLAVNGVEWGNLEFEVRVE